MKIRIVQAALLVPFAALLYFPAPGLADSILGSAQTFAVLGASTVTNTGATTIYGDLGLDPGTSITDAPSVTGGVIHASDTAAQRAQSDALTAYNTLKGLPLTESLTDHDLGGLTLTPGVYMFDSSAQLTGTLTLDFFSNPAGFIVFQIGTTLTTASGSLVNVINGGPLSSVYWQVGSSATLGTGTIFAGNILADQSVTLNTTADILCGRAIGLNAAVTLDNNEISNNNSAQDFGSLRSDFGSYGFSGGSPDLGTPEPATLIPLTLGLAAGFLLFRALRRNVNG